MKTGFVSLARSLLKPLIPKLYLGTKESPAAPSPALQRISGSSRLGYSLFYHSILVSNFGFRISSFGGEDRPCFDIRYSSFPLLRAWVLALLVLLLTGLPMQRSLALPGTPRADASNQADAPLTCPPNCGTAYTVDSTGDGAHVGAQNQCTDGTGHCTLRAAIEVVNFNGGDDGIFFDIPTTDPGYSNGVWTINLGTALPDLSSNISISGPGAAMLTVQRSFSATAEFRVFNITGTNTVTLSGLTIRNGKLSSSNPGAGIQNTGTLSVTNCTVSGNSGLRGGGISNASGATAHVTDSAVTGNSAPTNLGEGGGILNDGVMTVANTTLSANSAPAGGGLYNQSTLTVANCTFSGNSGTSDVGGVGGGIYNLSGGLIVTNSTFSGNSAGGPDFQNPAAFARGGAIATQGGTLTLSASTFSGNTATGGVGSNGAAGGLAFGGALWVGSPSHTTSITNCTFALNSAFGGNGSPAGQASGGGIYTNGDRLDLKSTIVAANTAFNAGAPAPDVSGAFTSQGFNLIGKIDGSTGFPAGTDQAGTIASPLDPMLGTLQNNGGPTQTIALQPGSPAIDKGTSNSLIGQMTTDQRGTGYPRTFDDPGIPNATGSDGTDIGSFELQTIAPTILANISTRLPVGTGDNVLIGGFIITGTQPKKVIARAIGPSLTGFGIAGALADPILELHGPGTFSTIINDNWRSDQQTEIIATGFAPTNDLESAIVATLPANNSAYTAIVRGANDGTGIGLVEAYDLDHAADSRLGNISTRGLVQTGDNVLIAGTIVAGVAPQRVIIRAIGPSLPFAGTLADPILELRDANGALLQSNDNWRTDQQAEIIATGIPPSNDLESAIVTTLPAGGAASTAIVRGVNGTTGVALVEIYAIGPP
jgi:hypothetical protein